MQCRHFSVRLTPQHLIEDEERLNTFLEQVRVHSVQTALLSARPERWSVLVFFEERQSLAPIQRAEPIALPQPEAPELTEAERRVFERLRAWRGEQARAEGLPPYVVAHNAALRQIARSHTTIASTDDLAGVKHLGAQKIARYGATIVQVVRLATEAEDGALVEDDYAS